MPVVPITKKNIAVSKVYYSTFQRHAHATTRASLQSVGMHPHTCTARIASPTLLPSTFFKNKKLILCTYINHPTPTHPTTTLSPPSQLYMGHTDSLQAPSIFVRLHPFFFAAAILCMRAQNIGLHMCGWVGGLVFFCVCARLSLSLSVCVQGVYELL